MFPLPDLTKERQDGRTTLYMTLYESVKQSIISGKIESDEKLPSKRRLAARLGVSVKTVENAYEQLLLEGYIYSREKSGYFASQITGYRFPGHKRKMEHTTRFSQTEYRVNLRANRNSLEDFPADTWRKLIRETINEDKDEFFRTVPFNGLFELRKAIAEHLLLTRGMEVSPDRIIVGAGTEYLYGRLRQILGSEAVYALTDPCSRRLHELYENNRMNYKTVKAARTGFDMEALERADCDVLHISPAHQYPLGRIMPIQERIQLLLWVNRRKNRYIIEDDYDSEYVVVGRPIQQLYSIDVNDRVIYMNTFSKSVSPAVRISYMVLPERLMQRYLETMSFYTCTVASLEQYVLAKFIERKHLERFIHRVNRKNHKIRQILVGRLEKLHEQGRLTLEKDCAGTMLIIQLKTARSDMEIKKFLKERSILTSMLSEYYNEEREKELYAGRMIVNYSGMTNEMIDYLCCVLEEI